MNDTRIPKDNECREAPVWMKEGREPTPEEWLEYYGDEVPIEVAKKIIKDRNIASTCFTNDHSGRIQSMQSWIDKHTPEPTISSMSIKEVLDEIVEFQRETLGFMEDHELQHMLIVVRLAKYKHSLMSEIGHDDKKPSLGDILRKRDNENPHEGGFL